MWKGSGGRAALMPTFMICYRDGILERSLRVASCWPRWNEGGKVTFSFSSHSSLYHLSSSSFFSLSLSIHPSIHLVTPATACLHVAIIGEQKTGGVRLA
ncbi:hypothetical protein E2C01_064308 [Portunus trituberculatus]|uniref:Uncharacterized protein n=1 Tax=Portunus trituberculatus TaxID=210409 RepID=A0A5B7HBC4_PORTR|nr:hypothetical protein [Portunus trituberculatus]